MDFAEGSGATPVRDPGSGGDPCGVCAGGRSTNGLREEKIRNEVSLVAAGSHSQQRGHHKAIALGADAVYLDLRLCWPWDAICVKMLYRQMQLGNSHTQDSQLV
jgi:hypothetical protein